MIKFALSVLLSISPEANIAPTCVDLTNNYFTAASMTSDNGITEIFNIRLL